MKANPRLTVLSCLILSVGLSAPLRAQKQIDIGAAEAPLSDAERVDLDKAVSKHDYAAEKAVIDRALAEHPGSFELLVMAGRLAWLEKHAKDSADAYLRAEKISPVNDADREALAMALSFSDRVPEAREQFVKLMKLSPRNAEYAFLLGRIDANSHHFEDAASWFRKAIEFDPGMVRAYEELGHVQESLGMPDDARETFEKGAARNRVNKVQWEWSPLDLGVVLLKANELDAAEKLFRESLGYNPHFGDAHYYLGQVLQKRKLDEDAVLEYKEAVADEPQLRPAWLALGQALSRQGNSAEADKALAIFKRLESEDNARRAKKN